MNYTKRPKLFLPRALLADPLLPACHPRRERPSAFCTQDLRRLVAAMVD
jgi:hypothetical protein